MAELALSRITSGPIRDRAAAQLSMAFASMGGDIDSAVRFYEGTRNNFGLIDALFRRALVRQRGNDIPAAIVDLKRALERAHAEQSRQGALSESRQRIVDELIDLMCADA